MIKRHYIKIDSCYTNAFLSGRRSFIIQPNRPKFSINDNVLIKFWNTTTSMYTGKKLRCRITSLSNDSIAGIQEGYVILNLKIIYTKLS